MKNPQFEKELIQRRRGSEFYRVKGIEGMTKQEILDACDLNNFGGWVRGNIVEVFID